MFRLIATALAPLFLLTAVGVADAATYVAQLSYRDANGTSQQSSSPYGKVTLEELDTKTIKVSVTLNAPEIGFLNTGGPHDPFLFNLTGDYDVAVTNTGNQTFYDAGYDSNTSASPNFTATPFGNFTNKIGCCGDKNGASHASPPPLVFTVSDANGISVAGINPTLDTSGTVLNFGTGDRFGRNSGGWLFAADLVDTIGNTFNVAANYLQRLIDPTVQPPPSNISGVPEPGTWMTMLVGFALVGGAIRRQRRAPAPSL